MTEEVIVSKLPGVFASDLSGDVPVPFWHGSFYPGLINTVAGKSGGGKSTIVARVVADLTLQGKNVIWAAEEDPLFVTYRIRAAGGDTSKVRFHKFMLPTDLNILRECILADNAAMVVFDTAEKHINAPQMRWGKVLDKLDPVAYETGCAMLFIHHVNKNVKKTSDPLSSLGGHIAGIGGSSRMVFLVGPNPQDNTETALCRIKNAYGKCEYDAITFATDVEEFDQSNGTTVEVAHASISQKDVKIVNPIELVISTGHGESRGPTPEQLTAACEFLTKLLADGPVPVSDAHRCPTHGHFSQDTAACPTCNGPLLLVTGAKTAAEDADLTWHGAVKRGRKHLEIEISRKGSGKGSVPYVRLPVGDAPDAKGKRAGRHPALSATAPDTLS